MKQHIIRPVLPPVGKDSAPLWNSSKRLLVAALASLAFSAPARCEDGAAAAAPAEAGAAPAAPSAAAAPADKPTARPQHHRSAAQVLEERVRALTQELNLDAKQRTAVRDVLIKERMAILELRRGGAQGGQDFVAASHAIVDRTRNDIRALLNPEQRRKFFVDVPEDKLAPAQVDRDHWLDVARPKAVAPAVEPAMAPPAK